MNLGNMAYENWDLQDALRYYQTAYEENPNAALQSKINGIKAELAQMSISAKERQKPGDNPWKWALLAADAVGVAGSVYTYIDYNAAWKKYNELHDLWWNSDGSYDDMVRAEGNAMVKSMFAFGTISVAGGLILYTIVDVIWLHFVFTENVETTYIPGKNELKLTYNFAF